jgi:UDP-2-acetamido-2,6-beta-L-arabino-hexul-4-ose reductase
LNILITGSRGFIGQHLVNSLKYKSSFDYNLIGVNKNDFKNLDSLDSKVKKSTIIVHLAALNRHDDESFIYESNMLLSKILVDSIKRVGFKGKLIFSSSIQESLNNSYGKSKKDSRNLFIKESKLNGFNFSGLVLPNVYGPFGKPNYNSFIPTFCQKILNGRKVEIIENSKVLLVYIDTVVSLIINEIESKDSDFKIQVNPEKTISVNEVKDILIEFKTEYIDNNTIPKLENDFELNLFNTFRSFINIQDFFPIRYKDNIDERGNFIEILRSNSKGQYSYSTTKPNITRGNHFHTKKIERFSVIKGKSIIQLRRIGTDEIIELKLSGDNPSYVDMPVWYTHNILNIGDEELVTLFWINEPYDINNPDTYTEKV